MLLKRYSLVLVTTSVFVSFTNQTSLAFSLNLYQLPSDTNCDYYCASISSTMNGVGKVTTTLNNISELPLGGTNDFLSLLNSVWGTNGWTFNKASNPLNGGFTISPYRPYASFDTANQGTVGADIKVTYNPATGDPTGNQIYWIQEVTSNHAVNQSKYTSVPLDLGYGINEQKIDVINEQRNPTSPSPDFNPYYNTYGKATSSSFFDLPTRKDIQDNNKWSANLYLVQQTAPKTVTIYDGISYGWSNVFVPQKPKKLVDLELLFDTTGSMGSDIGAAESSAANILSQLDNSGVDYRIAIADYKDFPEQDGYPYRADLPFTTDKTAITNTIDSMGSDIGGGGDTPESAYSGLINSINTNGLGSWRDGATKATIIMSDAPPHDPEPHTGYTSQDVINAAFAVDPDQIYSIIPNGDPTAVSYFSKITSATNGNLYTPNSSNGITNSFLDIISKITGSPYSPVSTDENPTTNDGNTTEIPESSSIIGVLTASLAGLLLRQRKKPSDIDKIKISSR